jgi:hypothetical protein
MEEQIRLLEESTNLEHRILEQIKLKGLPSWLPEADPINLVKTKVSLFTDYLVSCPNTDDAFIKTYQDYVSILKFTLDMYTTF